MRIPFIALFLASGLLASCMQSNVPEQSPSDTQPIKNLTGAPLLQDPDGNPVLEAPVDILEDIRKQMIEKGFDQQVKNLEAAYDFKTGKARVSLPQPK